MMEVNDEMLMAYADGELDPKEMQAIARAVAADPALARRVGLFRTSRAIARDTLSADLQDPLPERLVAAVMQPANSAAQRGWATSTLLPLAAALVVAAGLGGYFLGNRAGDGVLAANEALVTALDASLTGETLGAGDGAVKLLSTFRTKQGTCRMFETSARKPVRGLGCHQDGRWHVVAAVAESGEGGFAPASGAASLDAVLDDLDAQSPLSTAEEEALRKNGWE
ncbi:anti-sigma factor family protein [Flaviflagellibacter deserti]|uniref:Anti-sigma factor family protein n=1 Tax=Flaviflagellibacter deserti TaxID=2267266 RepID=A0ABV9Z733_9HYPH